MLILDTKLPVWALLKGAEEFEKQFTVQWKEVLGNEILLPSLKLHW